MTRRTGVFSIHKTALVLVVAATLAFPAATSAATTNDQILSALAGILQTFARMLAAMPQQQSVPIASGGNQYMTVVASAPSQRIDNLANVTISNATVNGVSGLAAGDIPDLSSKYLPVSGGTISGSLTLTNATSTNFFATTASSTNLFAQTASLGSLTLTTPLAMGSGGTGWANINSGSILFGNGASALATSSNLFWDNTNNRLGIASTTPATNLSVGGNIYATGGLGVGVLNTTAGTLQTSGSATINGTLGVNAGLNLTGTFPSINWGGAFGSWQTAQDIASDIYPSDFVLAVKCQSLNATCPSVYDQLYDLNNQDGMDSVAVGSGGSGYIAGQVVTLNTQSASFTGSISGTTLTVSSMSSGALAVGMPISGSGTGSPAPIITAQLTGTPGQTGTYSLLRSPGTIGSEAMSADFCIVRPSATIGSIGGGGAIASLSVYTQGGRGRCAVDPSGAFPLTGGGGSGATATPTMKSNFPTLALGQGSNQSAIQAGYTPFAFSINPPTFFPEYGGLDIKMNGVSTGALFSITSGSVHNLDIDQNANLNFLNHNGTAAAPLISLNGPGLYSDGVGAGNLGISLGGANVLTVKSTSLDFPGSFALSIGGTSVVNVSTTTGFSTQPGVAIGSSGGYYLNGSQLLVNTGTYTTLQAPAGSITLGYSGDGTNYYNQSVHKFRSQNGSATYLTLNSTGATFTGSLTAAGNVGIGTTSPFALLSVAGSAGGTTPLFTISSSTSGFATSSVFRIDQNGLVGIGTTSPTTALQVNGVITPNADNTSSLGNATYRWSSVFAANGTIQTSDARLKSNVNDLSYGLPDLLKLRPVSFTWTAQPQQGTQLGFIAQEVQPIFPETVNVGDDANHTLGLTYTEFIPIVVKSIQQIASISGDFQTNLIAWLGNASNGINDLFAKNIYATNVTAHQVTADELCAGTVCVNQQQLAAILVATGQTSTSLGQGSGASGTSATSTPDTPPVIQINGNNPATITVGSTYSDLGATITGPTQDLNLDIHTFLNGALESQIVIDTSQVATDTIDYVVADQNGLTSTSTRTVIVQAAPSATSTTP